VFNKQIPELLLNKGEGMIWLNICVAIAELSASVGCWRIFAKIGANNCDVNRRWGVIMSFIRTASLALAVIFSLSACGDKTGEDKTKARLKAAQAAYYQGDFKTAASIFQAMAEQGNARAQFFLGEMYLNGSGVPRDYAQALKWARAAAEQNDSDAQYTLGGIYESGKGVPQDYAQAHMWYSLSSSSGDEQAIRKKAALETKMNTDQLAESQRQEQAWISAHKGTPLQRRGS
jgi:hypothetical protein